MHGMAGCSSRGKNDNKNIGNTSSRLETSVYIGRNAGRRWPIHRKAITGSERGFDERWSGVPVDELREFERQKSADEKYRKRVLGLDSQA